MPTPLAIVTIDAHSSREELTEALDRLSHEAGRVMVTDPRHAALHRVIDQVLGLWERQTLSVRPSGEATVEP